MRASTTDCISSSKILGNRRHVSTSVAASAHESSGGTLAGDEELDQDKAMRAGRADMHPVYKEIDAETNKCGTYSGTAGWGTMVEAGAKKVWISAAASIVLDTVAAREEEIAACRSE